MPTSPIWRIRRCTRLRLTVWARLLEKYHHLAAAVERVPGVFLVDQAAEQQVAFVGQFQLLMRIDILSAARYAENEAGIISDFSSY